MANSFSVNTYSASEVRLIIGGYQITGWESITITRSVKGFNPIRGIRGKNTRIRNTDSSATITIPLLQTSPSNDVFSSIHEQDLQFGTGRLSLTLKDGSGRSVFSSGEAYITGFPTTPMSGQFEYRPWEIFAQTTDTYTVAGNTRPSNSLFDAALNEATNFVDGLL